MFFKMNDVLCVILCVVELATHDQFCKKRAITFLGEQSPREIFIEAK